MDTFYEDYTQSDDLVWVDEGVKRKGRCHIPTVVATLILLVLFYFGAQYVLSDKDDFDGESSSATSRTPFNVEQYGTASSWRSRSEVKNIDCAEYFDGSKRLGRGSSMNEHPLEMHCHAIRSRVFPFRNSDTGFPIAFSKTVFMDYELLEEQLTLSYALENSFCFAVDKKAKDLFKRRLRRLADCLPNVIVIDEEFELDRLGHNQNAAHLSCMKALLRYNWKYLIVLQNHDIMLKAHWELGRIFSIMNGTSDIEVSNCAYIRCEPFLDTNISRLNLCLPPSSCNTNQLQWAKGAQQSSLSREAVSFILNRINTDALVRQLNFLNEGADEILLPTLAISEIGFPGGYTSQCLPGKNTFITRYSRWRDNATSCSSGVLRHFICILGTRDLPFLSNTHHIIANKMMPSVDYTAIHCMSRLVFNRSRLYTPSILRDDFYANIQSVRYNKLISDGNNTSTFEC